MKPKFYDLLNKILLTGLFAFNISCSSSEITRESWSSLRDQRVHKPGNFYNQKTFDHHIFDLKLKKEKIAVRVDVRIVEREYELDLRERLYCGVVAVLQGRKFIGYEFPKIYKEYLPLILDKRLISSNPSKPDVGIEISSNSRTLSALDGNLNEKNVFATDDGGRITFYLRYYDQDSIISEILNYNEFQARNIRDEKGVIQVVLEDTLKDLEPVNEYYIFNSQLGEVVTKEYDDDTSLDQYIRENKTLFVLLEKSPSLIKKEKEEERRRIAVETKRIENEKKRRTERENLEKIIQSTIFDNLTSLRISVLDDETGYPLNGAEISITSEALFYKNLLMRKGVSLEKIDEFGFYIPNYPNSWNGKTGNWDYCRTYDNRPCSFRVFLDAEHIILIRHPNKQYYEIKGELDPGKDDLYEVRMVKIGEKVKFDLFGGKGKIIKK